MDNNMKLESEMLQIEEEKLKWETKNLNKQIKISNKQRSNLIREIGDLESQKAQMMVDL